MLRSLSISFVVGLSTLAVAAGGCSSGAPDSSEEGVATAVIAITNAPTDVRCVQLLVQGTRSVEQSFDVLPGQSTQFQLNGLPAGMANFSGNAFDVPCVSVDNPDYLPNWVADPVAVQLQSGAVTQVTLPFRRNVRAQVNADFQEDGTCQTNGAPCSTAAQCCSTFCVGGTCQAQQCTPNALPCDPDVSPITCCSGICGADRLCASTTCGANPCTTDAQCCSGLACVAGVCGSPQCLPTAAACAGSSLPCCGGVACVNGVCGGSGCSLAGSPCGSAIGCCSGLSCLGGVCQPGTGTCSPPLIPCQLNSPCCSGLTCNNIGAVCDPGGCQIPGLPCVENSQCCSLFCDPASRRCL